MNSSNYTQACQVCNEQYTPTLNKDGTPYKTKHSICSNKCRNKHKLIGNIDRKCKACGVTFRRRKRKNDAALYCSRECGYEVIKGRTAYTPEQRAVADHFYSERDALRRIAANIKRQIFNRTVKPEIDALRRIRKYRVAATKVIGACGCGSKFMRMRLDHKYGGSYDFCNPCRKIADRKSKRKGRRIAKAVRRARMKSVGIVERIDPFEVLNAFNWTCYICKKKTPKRLRGTYEDRAPEVDHIVPLSKGGDHTFSNLACACRKCNLEKSNNEFFLL